MGLQYAPEAAQPQRVEDDRDARERHREAGQQRVQQAGRRERDRGDVVAEGPAEVLADRAQRGAREPDRVGGAAQVAGDQRQVGGLDRDVGAGADRQPEVRGGQRGRVVDAVAGHRDHAALGLQAPDHVGLLRRAAPRRSPRRCRPRRRRRAAVASLSPVSRTVRSPSACSRCDRLGGRRLDRVGHGQQPAHLAVPGDEHRGAAAAPRRPAGRRRAPPGSAGSTPPAATGARSATPRPPTTPSTPRPSRLTNDSTGSSALRSRAAAAIACATGCSEASSSAPATASSSASSMPSAATISASAIRPVVTVPVLSSTIVSTRRVDSRISGPLISRPSCAPRPVPTSSAVGVASPSAHGQAMISTATAAREREREVLARADPEAERGERDAEHDRHEDARDPVGEPLDRRLAGLRLGDQARDLGQRGVGADLRRAHDEPAAGVDARARDLVAGLLLDRHGLAGQQRLVDGGRARLDDAVGRDLLAGAHDEAVADGELLDRHAALGAVGVEDRDVLGAELEQRGQRRPGAALGAAPRSSARRG